MITAADALLDNEHLHRDEVVPTVAFAALASEMPELDAKRNRFAQAGRDPKRWEDLRLGFWDLFTPWRPKCYDNEVLIVRRDAINMVVGYDPDSNVTDAIEIEVADNSIGRDELAKLYKRALGTYEVGSHGSPAGGIEWSVQKGKIRMVVRPEGRTLDPHHLSARRLDEQPPFPDPTLVADMYVVLRGSEGAKNRFPGFGVGGELLPGRDRGETPEGRTLVPAYVAWYALDRGLHADAQDKQEVTSLLFEEGILPEGKSSPQLRDKAHQQLWSNVRKRSGSFREAEDHIRAGLEERSVNK